MPSIICSTSSISCVPTCHAYANLSPAAGGADEVQGGADRHRLLVHQLDPEMARVWLVWIEATTVVGYQQHHIRRTNLEHQVHASGLSVFGNIVQRFPSNSGQCRLRCRWAVWFIGHGNANLAPLARLQVSSLARQCSGESSQKEMKLVRAQVMKKRPQFCLAVIRQAQHLVDDGMHLCGVTALEQHEDARCAEGDAVQTLCDAVVQLACKAPSLLVPYGDLPH